MEFWCVNSFATSQLYEDLKPINYVLADPAYWEKNTSERLKKIREDLFEKIKNKTTWKLRIFVPFEAKSHLRNVFSSSKPIEIITFNSVPVAGPKNLVAILYQLGLGMPSPQNVLIAAIYLGLRLGHKNLLIIGADHSWHESIALDNENTVSLIDKHFYGNIPLPFYRDNEEILTFTMPELFRVLAKTFEGYWALNDYANYLGAEILNASSTSFIDAFKRSNIHGEQEANKTLVK